MSKGLQFQTGDANFMPSNQTVSISNDDQSTWALAAMSAAEQNLPAPGNTSWIALADEVFNEQVLRWDEKTCGGGLRWMVFPFSNGYNYKNSNTNGNFFQLASRLARYTGNVTYSDWANRSFNWSKTIGFIDSEMNVWDGASADQNCASVNKQQFSSVSGTYITGAAHLYNISTGDAQVTWKKNLDGLLNATLDLYFPNGIAKEVVCDDGARCTLDMKFMKGILAQQLVDTIQVAPYTADSILPKLTTSAQAAAKVCDSTGCPLLWDGTLTGKTPSTLLYGTGMGETFSVLSYVQGLLVGKAKTPVTEKTAGAAAGNGTTTGTSGTQTNSTSTTSPTSSGSGAPQKTTSAAHNLQAGLGLTAALLATVALAVL